MQIYLLLSRKEATSMKSDEEGRIADVAGWGGSRKNDEQGGTLAWGNPFDLTSGAYVSVSPAVFQITSLSRTRQPVSTRLFAQGNLRLRRTLFLRTIANTLYANLDVLFHFPPFCPRRRKRPGQGVPQLESTRGKILSRSLPTSLFPLKYSFVQLLVRFHPLAYDRNLQRGIISSKSSDAIVATANGNDGNGLITRNSCWTHTALRDAICLADYK